MNLEETLDSLIKNYEKKRVQNEYLRKKLIDSTKIERRNLHGSQSSSSSKHVHEKDG